MKSRCFAELLCTFAMVFAGTGAIVVNDTHGGVVSHAGIAITFGLIVTVMIYAVGDVSGAHLNPAVTLAFWRSGRYPGREVLPYVAAQLAGALLASAMLHVMFPTHATLGATMPGGPWWQSFVMETILSAMLMFVILSVSTGAKEKGITAAIAIGGTVMLEAMFAGPVCGASMNPARSLGPALVSGHWSWLWIYLTAPVLGAWLAVPLCRAVHAGDGCCASCA
ncbi:MAG: aquaporin [Planctomycetes bacterium]|nr:aquaporin [Planctomycetota bacterium]